MKKILIISLLAIVPTIGFSKGSSYSSSDDPSSGIVTPDVATGVKRIPAQYATHRVTGEMVYCERSDVTFSNSDCKNWKDFKDAVPNGRKYVGFSVSRDYYFIYWK